MVPVSGISESEYLRVIDCSFRIFMRLIPDRLEYDRLAGLSRGCVYPFSSNCQQIQSNSIITDTVGTRKSVRITECPY